MQVFLNKLLNGNDKYKTKGIKKINQKVKMYHKSKKGTIIIIIIIISLLLFLYLNSVKILKYTKYAYKPTLSEADLGVLQHPRWSAL